MYDNYYYIVLQLSYDFYYMINKVQPLPPLAYSYSVATVVNKLKEVMSTRGLADNVFDEFSILRPVKGLDLCHGHYLCPMADPYDG